MLVILHVIRLSMYVHREITATMKKAKSLISFHLLHIIVILLIQSLTNGIVVYTFMHSQVNREYSHKSRNKGNRGGLYPPPPPPIF